jgi:hypothetical protein
MDVEGRVVMSGSSRGTNVLRIPVQGLSGGHYTVRMIHEGRTCTAAFTVQ